MFDDHLVDLPDDQYRAHWLAFHEHVDWSTHKDVTAMPVTFNGPDALYRRNKGSFMERLQPQVHCRPYAAHARHARRTGAWIPEEKIFETALVPTLDLTPPRRKQVDLAQWLRKCFHHVAAGSGDENDVYVPVAQAATAASNRLASTP